MSADRIDDPVVGKIDRHLDDFWARNEITPAPIADDAEFLRRLSLDLVGRIPTAAEARAFIESKDPDKRTKKIDELLGRPGLPEPLRQRAPPDVGAADHRQPAASVRRPRSSRGGSAQRLKDNTPMDKIVRELLTVRTLFAGRGPQTFRFEASGQPVPVRAGQRVQAGERGRGREPAVHGREDRVRPVPQPPVRPVQEGTVLGAGRLLRRGPAGHRQHLRPEVQARDQDSRTTSRRPSRPASSTIARSRRGTRRSRRARRSPTG